MPGPSGSARRVLLPLVDGNIVHAHAVDGRTHRFNLPVSPSQVTIASRTAVPCDTEANSLDSRRLGVPLEHIVLRGTGLRVEVRPDHVVAPDKPDRE